jgi:Terminase RNaseH-like domain
VLEKTIAPPETAMFSPVGESPSNRLVEGSIVYDLVYLKRPKLETAYDVIARRVAALICKLEPQGAFGELGQVTLCVDGTGVGRGVVDMIRAEFQRRGAMSSSVPGVDFRPVSITGSNTSLKKPERTNGYWSVPKKDLIFPAVAAFQQSKIRIAKGITDRGALVHELRNYSRKTNIAMGNMVFEPWREAAHDDLLFAVLPGLVGLTAEAPKHSAPSRRRRWRRQDRRSSGQYLLNSRNSGTRLPHDGPQDQPGGRGLERPPGTPSLGTAAPDDEPTLIGDVTHLLGPR